MAKERNTDSGWKLYGVWWLFQWVRQTHTRLQEKDSQIAELKTEAQEWQNKLLVLSNLKPLHHKPTPLPAPAYRAPIGPTDKNSILAQQAAERAAQSRPSEQEILEAANAAIGHPNGSK